MQKTEQGRDADNIVSTNNASDTNNASSINSIGGTDKSQCEILFTI